MQNLDWDDLKIVIALHRSRSFSEAANLLGINSTTVARRLSSLESRLAVQLVLRTGRQTFQLTDAGQDVLQVALRTENEIQNLGERIVHDDQVISGRIALTAAPVICNRVLIPASHSFCQKHPQLELQLLADNRNLSLEHRDADIALRLGMPVQGGQQLKARKIASLRHAVYGARTTDNSSECPPSWISYTDASKQLPQAQWLEQHIKLSKEPTSQLRVTDFDAAVEAVANGFGRSLLPQLMGDADQRLMRMDELTTDIEFPEREVWIMCRSDMAHLARVRATLDWLADVFSAGNTAHLSASICTHSKPL